MRQETKDVTPDRKKSNGDVPTPRDDKELTAPVVDGLESGGRDAAAKALGQGINAEGKGRQNW